MSEHSESKKDDDDVELEKRSEQMHDAPPAAESEEHVSNTADRKDGTKEQESTQKEKEKDEVSQTSKVQHVAPIFTKRRPQFVRIFTYKDDKKILKALFNSGYTTGSKPFWEHIGASLKLSIPVDQKQLYGKIRRLKEDYLKQHGLCKDNFSRQERRLYQLSHDIWKLGEAEAKAKAKKSKQKQEDRPVHEEEEEEEKDDHHQEEDNYDLKLEKFVRGLHNDVKFPVAESLDVVPASKRSKLQKKWNDLNGHMFKVYMAKIELIRETMQVVVSSPSFPAIT